MIASIFDSSKMIDQNNWATTLISAQKGNHAMLCIEGIDRTNRVFVRRAHLLGPYTACEEDNGRVQGSYCYFGFGRIGRVRVEDKTGKEIRYSTKTDTWIRSAAKVSALLTQAKKEEEDPLANPQAFNIFGRKSLFANKVTTFKIESLLLKKIYQYNPNLLMKLYQKGMDKSKAVDGLLKCGTVLSNPFYDNPVISGIRELYLYCKVLLIKSYFDRIELELQSKITLQMKPRELYREIVYKKLMKQVRILPNSCFTWARKKLEIIDVELESKSIEFIISPTKMYATKV